MMPDWRHQELMRIRKLLRMLVEVKIREAERVLGYKTLSLVETVEQEKDRAEPLGVEILHPIWLGLPSGHHR